MIDSSKLRCMICMEMYIEYKRFYLDQLSSWAYKFSKQYYQSIFYNHQHKKSRMHHLENISKDIQYNLNRLYRICNLMNKQCKSFLKDRIHQHMNYKNLKLCMFYKVKHIQSKCFHLNNIYLYKDYNYSPLQLQKCRNHIPKDKDHNHYQQDNMNFCIEYKQQSLSKSNTQKDTQYNLHQDLEQNLNCIEDILNFGHISNNWLGIIGKFRFLTREHSHQNIKYIDFNHSTTNSQQNIIYIYLMRYYSISSPNKQVSHLRAVIVIEVQTNYKKGLIDSFLSIIINKSVV